MYPTGLIPNPSGISLPGAVSAPETVERSSAVGAEARQTPSYGRFSVAHSDTLPVYSAYSLFPVMPQTMYASPSTSRDFGSGISSVGDVSRSMPLLHQPAMAPDFDPESSHRLYQEAVSYKLYQESLRCCMESDFEAYGWTAAAPKNAMGVSSDSGQLASSEMLKREADTNEQFSPQTGHEHKVRKARTSFPEWKVHELNKAYAQHPYISGADRSSLASSLQMTDEQVKVWFQNKRSNSKKRLTQGSRSNFVQNMEASRAVFRAFLASQSTSPYFLQGVGVQKTYTLLSDRDVVCRTVAQSSISALQKMLAKCNSIPESRSGHSAAGSSQSGCPERELPVAATHTFTGGLTGGYDESDSSKVRSFIKHIMNRS